MNIVSKPVRNYSPGRAGYRVEAIVVHIAEGYLDGAYSWFDNPASQASSHYMVGKGGQIWRFVNETDMAWHAGGVAFPSWVLLKPNVNPNLYTIGIEHEGFSGEPWTDAMYQSCAELIADICRRYGIPVDRNHIIGHNLINSNGRANCPGTGVNWDRLLKTVRDLSEDPIVIAQLQQQVQQLQASLNDAITRNNQLVAENTSLRQQMNTLEQRVLILEAQVANSGNTTQLQKQVKDLSNEVFTLQQNRNKLATQLAEAEAKLAAGGKPDLMSYSASELFAAATRKLLTR
jgi:N-acetyl-anhydromuramyl-L-alanine amidase AmpD